MNEGRRSRRRWLVPLLLLVAVGVAVVVTRDSSEEPEAVDEPAPRDEPVIEARDRTRPPSVGGSQLTVLAGDARPPEPAQWDAGIGPVPFSRWWSGLETGPGIPALWAEPLLLRMNEEGRADLSAPTETTRDDGFRDADIVPALFFEFGPDAVVRVTDHGSFHVGFTVSTDEVEVAITLVQGSPFIEFEGEGTLGLTVPALSGFAGTTDGPGVDRFSTAAGSWLLATSDDAELAVEGDRVDIALTPGVRMALAPAPSEMDESYEAAALEVVTHPLLGTYETLSVAPNGVVQQVLEQRREGDGGVGAWGLLPHHRDHLVSDGEALGSMESLHGTTPVIGASSLVLEYPAVPIVWNPAVADGFTASSADVEELPPIPGGSYFGGKGTATAAAVHDVLVASGDSAGAEDFLESASASLGALLLSGSEPELTWASGWGSVVVAPGEFGSDTQLNDHQLQNGYWVGAAASVVLADPSQQGLLEDGIDLLIADYAGSGVVPHLAGVTPTDTTWSSFAGHSWASGIGGFSAGNNLESVSESSYAWWAAAKWFLATDRPELAEPFIARLTIESWLTGYEWLPTAANQSDDETLRPWSGVVWASKVDPGTWFHASDEAALGIRLLPIGPQAFSRYPDAAAVEAAQDRWDWCDERGEGCVERWWNLLDGDAAVAGRETLSEGDEPEESTTDIVRRWWRAHWEATSVADGWQCSPGTTMRRDASGSLVALVSNPSSSTVTAICTDPDGGADVVLDVEARSAELVTVSPT